MSCLIFSLLLAATPPPLPPPPAHDRAVAAVAEMRADNDALRHELATLRAPRQASAVVGEAVHVAYPGLDDVAEAEHLDPVWDFGDGTAARPGFNAAHVYDAPGVYGLTLDGEPFATVAVRADDRPVREVADLATLAAEAIKGGVVRLPPGRIVVTRPVRCGAGLVLLGADDGTSSLRAVGGIGAILAPSGPLTVRGVAFDADFPDDGTKGPTDAVFVTPQSDLGDLTLIDCWFGNLNNVVVLPSGGRLRRVLVERCVAPLPGGIRSYFVGLFGRAEDVAVYDSLVANSTGEHCVRLSGEDGPDGGTFRAAVVGNTLTNLDRRDEGVSFDTAKGTIVMQKGAHGYAAYNALRGASGAGPLSGPDGARDPAGRWRFAVWRHNAVAGAWQADHGLEHARFEFNAIGGTLNTMILEVKGRDPERFGGREVLDLLVRHNALRTAYAAGNTVQIWSSRGVRLVGNTLDAGPLDNPHGGAIPLLVFPTGLPDGFESEANAYALPAAGRWPPGSPHAALAGDQNEPSSYLTADQWHALPQTKGDDFE